jgi:hypothetical protein
MIEPRNDRDSSDNWESSDGSVVKSSAAERVVSGIPKGSGEKALG